MTTQSEPLKPINYDKLRKDYLRDMAEIEGKEVIKTPEPLETPTTPEGWEELAKNTPFKGMGKQIYELTKPLETPSELVNILLRVWDEGYKAGYEQHGITKEVPKAKAAIERLMADEVRKELEQLEPLTHDGRGTILWEMDNLSSAINERIAQLSNTKGEQSDETN